MKHTPWPAGMKMRYAEKALLTEHQAHACILAKASDMQAVSRHHTQWMGQKQKQHANVEPQPASLLLSANYTQAGARHKSTGQTRAAMPYIPREQQRCMHMLPARQTHGAGAETS
jgi:hypothetical protein